MSSNIRIKKICQHCNKVFIAKTTVTKFCSDACAKANYKKRIKEQKIDTSRRETMLQMAPESATREEISYSNKPSRELITLLELSTITGLSRSTFYRLMKDKKFPRLKVGKRLLFKKVEVLNYITDKYGNV
jgi:excisionase family DNA binding protein